VQIKACDFSKTIMRNCGLQQLKIGSKNERRKFDLSTSKFEETDLSGSVFYFCDLKKVNFKKANLERVIFEKCNLKEANLTDANLSGINFSDSKIENTVLDIEGVISFGNSQGFVLKPAE
jgi:uncharacterized protein YjbI with pentapeptide repeats